MDMRDLRKNIGLSRAKVAECLGLAESTIRNWERGSTKPTLSVDLYVKLLNLYKCNPKELEKASMASIGAYQNRNQINLTNV